MDDTQLKQDVLALIAWKQEGSYWDFKEKHHHDKASLLHDILCLANNLENRDAYLIFGITDRFEIVGVQNDEKRRNQQQLLDFLKKIKFAGGIRPVVALKTISLKDAEVDVMIIRNSRYTPFYLSESYKEKQSNREVRREHIYTRVGDTNTDIDKGADINHVEWLWRKRFGLELTPFERITHELCFKNKWNQQESDTKEQIHHSLYPEYTVQIESESTLAENPPAYAYAMTNEKTILGKLRLQVFGTTLYQQQVAYLDAGRYKTMAPSWDFIYGNDVQNDAYLYYYFVKDSIDYRLHRFLIDENSAEAKAAQRRLESVILIYEDEEERRRFEKHVRKVIDQLERMVQSWKSNSEIAGHVDEYARYIQQKKLELELGRYLKQELKNYREFLRKT